MKGKLYGVGIGPGDPNLVTQKAVEILGRCACIAIPMAKGRESTAYSIAKKYISKECRLLKLEYAMKRDMAQRQIDRENAAKKVSALLEEGLDVAFITLGDPTVYSTCMYLCRAVKELGFAYEMIPGITSFCAVSARLGQSLCEEDENFCVLSSWPDSMQMKNLFTQFETVVIMKATSDMEKLKQFLEGCEYAVSAITNCGLPGERIYLSAEQLHEAEGYFTTVIVRRL